MNHIISNWEKFCGSHQAVKFSGVALIGQKWSGKSTLCQLFQAFISDKQNRGLLFVKEKKTYVCEGFISSKTLKIMTKFPTEYEIEPVREAQDFREENILDVPAYLIPADAIKKESKLHSAISFNYLVKSVSDVAFVLLLEQKHTKAPAQGLKILVQTFLNFFTEHRGLLGSTMLIITKAPKKTKIDILSKRIRAIVEKIPQCGRIAANWIDDLSDRQAIIIQERFETQQQTRKAIIDLYTKIVNVPKYTINSEHIHSISKFTYQLREQLFKYLQMLNLTIEKYVCFLKEFFLENRPLREIVRIPDEFENSSVNESTIMGDLSQNVEEPEQQEAFRADFFDMVTLCHNLVKDSQDSSCTTPHLFLDMLHYFKSANILQEKDKLYVDFRDRALLYKRFFREINEISEKDNEGSNQIATNAKKRIMELTVIKQNVQTNIQRAASNFQQSQSLDYYMKLKNSIEYLFEPNVQEEQPKAKSLWIKCQLEIIHLGRPSKSLVELKQLNQKISNNNDHVIESQNCLQKISTILFQAKKLKLAITIASKHSDPYWLMLKMKSLLDNQKECLKYALEDFIPYLKFLNEKGLREKCIEICYMLGHYFTSLKDRKLIAPYLLTYSEEKEQQNKDIFDYQITKRLTGEEEAEIESISKQLELSELHPTPK